jgi:hypothetical protein
MTCHLVIQFGNFRLLSFPGVIWRCHTSLIDRYVYFSPTRITFIQKIIEKYIGYKHSCLITEGWGR